jgi:hypothetical protein
MKLNNMSYFCKHLFIIIITYLMSSFLASYIRICTKGSLIIFRVRKGSVAKLNLKTLQ